MRAPTSRTRAQKRPLTRRLTAFAAAALVGLGAASAAQAFCGFYVAKADGGLFNEASKVAMVRDGTRTVITMANDYKGPAQEFAMVIPTPTVLREDQIRVSDNSLIEHLDAYTAPRLVEYFDQNPCGGAFDALESSVAIVKAAPPQADGAQEDRAFGVTVEAEYTVGEYDILILSAEESGGLQRWLDANGYQTPEKARPVLESYIAQGMKFFVAKVNLEAQAATDAAFLRPLQIAFDSEKFMLPIRLGTVNAKGKQDLLLFTLSRQGRVEVANYRTAKIPTDKDIPLFVQKRFGDFYQAMFETAVERSGGRTVFTEYAWDMNWCDPCAADPLTVAQLRDLGVSWLPAEEGFGQPATAAIRQTTKSPAAVDVFVTRLHVRYDGETFPEDLRLMATGDRRNFQARFVTRHPFTGRSECAAGQAYRQELATAYERQARTLARLTSWDLAEIRADMRKGGQSPLPVGAGGAGWWKGLWQD